MTEQYPEPALFVGVAAWDVVTALPRPPAFDGRVLVDDLVVAGGGPAATAAVAYQRLGRPARLAAAVGNDDAGVAIRAGLEAEGVDTTLVRTREDAGSTSCVVLVDSATDSRSICARPGAAPLLSADEIGTPGWIHVDHQGLPVVEAALAGLPTRPLVSYDAGNLDPRPCPPVVDLYAPTVEALRELYGGADTDDLLDAALADGATWVVATDGPRGAYAADAGGHYRVPAHEDIEVRSTLGAGDVFHGALVAAFSRGMDLPTALAYANAAAALSCRGLDGRSAIPDHDRTLELAARRPTEAIGSAQS
ncbi:MAG: ribokinase [Streptosporangiales bacterium]|nr:ribokinase [Streptosporangiales bacterium]